MKGWHFDLFSFLIGVITTAFFFWMGYLNRNKLPEVRESIHRFLQAILPMRSNVELQFRKDVIHFAQKSHLLSRLFALDEILIPARVIPVLPPWNTKNELPFEDITNEAIPTILEDPLLPSTYRKKSFSLLEILANGNSRLIVMGELGSGKTTALLETALKLARYDHDFETLLPCLPLYLHASDLLRAIAQKQDLLIPLVEATKEHYSSSVRRSLLRFIRKFIHDHQLVILIDGLDEVTPREVDSISDYLKILLNHYPNLRMVVTASPNYFSDFVTMDFSPLLLCLWDKHEAQAFSQKWREAWQKAQLVKTDESILWTTWADQETHSLTPLEWTLFLLLLFSDYPTPSYPMAIYESSLTFSKLDPDSKQGIANWAYQVITKKLQNEPLPSPPAALDKLASSGFFASTSAQQIDFTNPLFLSFFASFALSDQESETDNLLQSKWEIAIKAAFLAQSKLVNHILPLNSPDADEYALYLTKLLLFLPPSSKETTQILRTVANFILKDQKPDYLRAKLLSAIFRHASEDRLQFIRFLLQSKEPFLRQLGALGYGLANNISDLKLLINLLEDPNPPCYQAACLALVNIGTATAIDAVIAALIHGHERLKDAAAQALANDPKIGHGILKEAAQHEDPRVRRASITGLLRINASWAKQIIQNMALEEELWLIKDLAANAIASLEIPNPLIPQKRPDTAELPWLIHFAGQKGIGLSPGKSNQDVLFMALEEGDPETQQAALDFFLFNPVQLAKPLILNLLTASSQDLRSSAYRTLWSFSVCREGS